jgi:hypothetical protein
MNQHNPYESPDELSVESSSELRPTKAVVSRVVEYAIAIILIVALIWVFMPLVHGNITWP